MSRKSAFFDGLRWIICVCIKTITPCIRTTPSARLSLRALAGGGRTEGLANSANSTNFYSCLAFLTSCARPETSGSLERVNRALRWRWALASFQSFPTSISCWSRPHFVCKKCLTITFTDFRAFIGTGGLTLWAAATFRCHSSTDAEEQYPFEHAYGGAREAKAKTGELGEEINKIFEEEEVSDQSNTKIRRRN